MADVGYITPAEAEEAAQEADRACGESRPSQPSVAPYFLEDVRKELEARYGAKQLYENGLSIQTALDVPLQEAANRALDEGLRRIDKRRGFRKPRRNVVTEGQAVETFKHPRWDRPMRDGDVVPAVVRSADAAAIEARAGALRVVIDRKGFAWAAKPANQLVTAGDLIEVRLAATRRGRPHRGRHARTTAGGRGRDPRDRQPHRPDQGHGRRLQLRAEQVQSRHAGAPPGRLLVQADRLHRRHRSRLHAGVADRRRAGELLRPAPASRRIRRRTTTTSSRARSRCATRSNSRATFRRSG